MASAGPATSQDTLQSQYLSTSISGLSRSRSAHNIIVKTYKQATQLYLTKRFRDALESLEPIVSPQPTRDGAFPSVGGAGGERSAGQAAPVAQSSKGTRTKVWVFYLSLLHAIVELGPEEGGAQFGSVKWRQLASKARDGTIWDEIVRRGYGGNEGEVDPDVVLNLVTLLLGHMQDQKPNQQRLEAYLLASAEAAPFASLPDGTATPMSNGTSSPKELTTRVRILELYTLHVLPANDELDYAQEFIEMNDMLDEERREAFLEALTQLREAKDGAVQRERELEELRERELAEQRAAEEAQRRKAEERKEAERRKKAELERHRPNPPTASTPSRPATARPRHTGAASNGPPPASQSKRAPPKSPPPRSSLSSRASSLLHHLPHVVMQAGRNLSLHRTATLRFLTFLAAVFLLLARRDLRLRVRRTCAHAWTKLRQTVGMGVKVSYI